jgi:hypothetical protein
MKHALKSIAVHPDARPFVVQCIITSILGNYYHAAMRPTALITVRDRITAIAPARIAAIFNDSIEPALAEYIAAKLPITPYIPTDETHVQWPAFVQFAIANANHKIRDAAPAPDRPVRAPVEPTPALVPSYIQCLAPTGHRIVAICTTCRIMSAYMYPTPYAYHVMRVPISPFAEPHDPDPYAECPTCHNRVVRIQMHGIMLCLKPSMAIVICPGCNHAHPIYGPLKTTLCCECIRVPSFWTPELARTTIRILADQPHPEVVRHVSTKSHTAKKYMPKCVAFQHPISGPVSQQWFINPVTFSIFSLPVCEYHICHRIIVSSEYNVT